MLLADGRGGRGWQATRQWLEHGTHDSHALWHWFWIWPSHNNQLTILPAMIHFHFHFHWYTTSGTVTPNKSAVHVSPHTTLCYAIGPLHSDTACHQTTTSFITIVHFIRLGMEKCPRKGTEKCTRTVKWQVQLWCLVEKKEKKMNENILLQVAGTEYWMLNIYWRQLHFVHNS